VQQQPGAEANQRGRVKAGVVNRQIERDLEAQVKRTASIARSSESPSR